MRRREALAGIASAGVVVGGGAAAVYGVPSMESLLGDDSDDDSQREPLEIETIDAPGSEAGTITIPDPDQATFIDLFGTWCPPCVDQMPGLAEANERIGDEVVFCSITNESVGENGAISEDELAGWWAEHDGDWLVGHDPTAEITARYLEGSFPTAVAMDASGTVQWADSGVKTADELVEGIETALEADDGSE
ncbi:TlpA family protein disulfide reductase [Natronolimnohabitans innermongolicus]|uniref:Alkyl hydroperoxide reductase/ thiol specific antioxidant/ Mal allergen n=1 Tax=Natronolimnohabitans innermongolicus JCM 12255 TaxID=1227499 RepID=L9WHF3_9EURY|nr:TlpA disulfide reductase family protein [Natronolimnohabitans innermongolicus]ELY48874.1 alkyl hydroperoxide reductase/ thiol specific antioxidant/ Mal allergen [Natronolimnohabitans innermongolicus JCM 12255]